MTGHEHAAAGGLGGVPLALGLLAVPLAGALVAYAVAAARQHPHGWPARRAALWTAGVTVAGIGAIVSVAGPEAVPGAGSAAPGGGLGPLGGALAQQVAGHLLLGMAAPLLLVLAAPVTLTLRCLPATRARRLTGVLGSRPVRTLTHPVTAGLIDVGGLWVLFATPLHAELHATPWGAAAVAAHMLAAGYLFTNALVGVDPAPHRPPYARRAAVLILALAAHAVLAKHLYGHPPQGVAAADARAAGLLMYYGGDAVHLALITVFCHQWSRADRRRQDARVRADSRSGDRQRQDSTRSRIVSGSPRSAATTDGATSASTSVIT